MRLSRFLILEMVVFACCASVLAADKPAPPPSLAKLAPADDLLRQVDEYLTRASEALADPNAFDLASQSRVSKDANALAALALVLAMHDQDFPQKASMPVMLQAAQELAECEGDYQCAVDALAQLKAARAGDAKADAPAKWEKVASLSALMKQVPLIHAAMKRGVGRRLASRAEQTTAQSAALAAIAQASIYDTEHALDDEEVEAWQKYCAEMRDSAGEVNAAIHAQDAARVDAGVKRLEQSCEACHATFRAQVQ